MCFWISVATLNCCIWQKASPRLSFGLHGRDIAMRGSRSSELRRTMGQGRRVLPPEPSHRPRGPAARGPLIQHQPVPRICAGHQRLQPQQFHGQPKAWLQGWRGEHRRDNSAPCVKVPSPACQSLPWPKAGLRDQPARGRTTGRARAAGRIRGKPERTR